MKDATECEKIKIFLEKLAAYEAALIHFRCVMKARINRQSSLFLNSITVELVHPRQEYYTAPNLEELYMTVMGEEEVNRLDVPKEIARTYDSARSSALVREHCEIQLVRYYLEHHDHGLVMTYFGVSKLSCFLCAAVLKALQDPEIEGKQFEFAVRGTHGKVYGRWRPPLDLKVPDDVTKKMRRCIEEVLEEVQVKFRDSIARYLVPLPMGSDSPEWSSGHSSEDDNDVLEWLFPPV
ncbi:hypothetical protein K440DRAFT_412519 [Wilcoxina mikolae CBS 423.85]|nr:hypothetical protein K440DRAFT_412519 [Wilcoxina mikolae CBS 423.85]